jgi:putative membrane protein insertion efficiency factor
MKKKASKIAIFLIQAYRVVLSPDHGFLKVFFRNPVCKFYPTCSHYAEEAILKYGAIKGSQLAISRLSRCHPWAEGGVDMVP